MLRKNVCPIAFFAIMLTTSGCESSNKGKIEGTKWTSLEANVKGEQVPPGSWRLEFGTDGAFVFDVLREKHTGTYSLGSKDTVTLKFDKELEGQKTPQEKVKIDGNKLTMTDSDGTSVTFEKAK